MAEGEFRAIDLFAGAGGLSLGLELAGINVVGALEYCPKAVQTYRHNFPTHTTICGDITQEVGLAQPTVSQHLKELRNAGLIKGSINGNSICYCIDKMHWKRARKMINSFMKKDIIGLKNCC